MKSDIENSLLPYYEKLIDQENGSWTNCVKDYRHGLALAELSKHGIITIDKKAVNDFNEIEFTVDNSDYISEENQLKTSYGMITVN